MSAIAGIWNWDHRPDASDACRKMLAVQRIYGPHDSAQWDGGTIALGRNLFDTVPEDRFDRQPLIGDGGRFILVADVRLDNRAELIGDLQIQAAEAAQLSDSAILLASWERWEDSCFAHLVGDYAFAVWDTKHRKFFLARDPFGVRTLHYHRGGTFFAFSSMPKGLHALPQIPRAPDEARTTEIFALVPEFGSRSFFEKIERVEAGQLLVVSPSRIAAVNHWNPKPGTIRCAKPEDYAEGLRAHLDEAVRARLRGAEDRVGTQLSGGLDSSAVTATAARILAPTGGKVVAFTAVPRQGYNGPEFRGRFGDEGPHAAATAALYSNIEHVLIRTDAQSPLDNLDKNFFLFERPIVNICNQVWYDAMNAKAQSKGLTVMLGAPMANLSMSYSGGTLLPRLIATGRWIRWTKEVLALSRSRHKSIPSSLAASFGPWIPAPLWQWLRHTLRGATRDVSEITATNMDTFRERQIGETAAEHGMDLSIQPSRRSGFETRIWAYRRADLGNYFMGWLGGWGIDVRDPSADRRLVEYCLGLPEDQYLMHGILRSLARRAFSDRLPKAVLTERRRGLQAADWHEGLTASRGRFVEEVDRLSENAAASASLDIERMRRLLADLPGNGWESDDIYIRYRLGLLRGVSAGHFLRKASGGNA